ncbi:hypothetical protein RRF57_010739 [Xylaria bambusicola]|uniref:Uncharacterized protein n=1 Tax=Xylaria bambusicola TaxID=326684 RepID=A0AAN7Z8X3_9PEZI
MLQVFLLTAIAENLLEAFKKNWGCSVDIRTVPETYVLGRNLETNAIGILKYFLSLFLSFGSE